MPNRISIRSIHKIIIPVKIHHNDTQRLPKYITFQSSKYNNKIFVAISRNVPFHLFKPPRLSLNIKLPQSTTDVAECTPTSKKSFASRPRFRPSRGPDHQHTCACGDPRRRLSRPLALRHLASRPRADRRGNSRRDRARSLSVPD